jgi:holo-[acyl-carrier protein] synthase
VIRGIGIDAVPVARMRLAIERTPRITERVFTARELETSSRRASRDASLAARFAAKEACRKALGVTLPWRSVEVTSDAERAPRLRVHGHEDTRFHVSLTHTDDLAVALVIAESVAED